jgi:DNA-binding transcriptional MerR regulator
MEGVATKLAMEKQLKSMGFSIGDLSKLIEIANNDAACGPECKRQKKLAELRDAITAAKKEAEDAPGNLAEAKKNYALYKDGQQGYLNSQLAAKRQEAEKKVSELNSEFDKRAQRTQTLIDEYEAMWKYNENTDTLLDTYITTNQRLTNDIDVTKSKIFTNDRRFHYYDQAIDWQWYVNKTVLVGYWAVAAAFVLYHLLYKGNYRNRRELIYGAGLVLLPFVITRILAFKVRGYSIQGFTDRIMNAVIGYV